MAIRPMFDDLTVDDRADELPGRRTAGGGIVVTAGRRPSPVPRPSGANATAFGRGCLDDDRDDDRDDAAGDDRGGDTADDPGADELARLVEAARREAEVLGHRRVGTEHLLLAVVRAGGGVGRAFGLRRAGAAVVAAVCARSGVPEPLVGPDGAAVVTAVAAGALTRATRSAAARGRRPGAADLGLALLDAGRSARLLADLGVDRDDLADVLSREALARPEARVARADVRPRVPAPIPVGTLAPVRLMLPGPSDPARTGAVTAPLRIGPPPGSPARRLGRGRVERVTRPDDDPALGLPA